MGSVPYHPIYLFGRVQGGGTPKADAQNWNGSLPFITPTELAGLDGAPVSASERTVTEIGATQSSVIEAGVLVSCRAPIGSIGTTTTKVAFNQGCKGISIPDPVQAKYVAYALIAARSELENRGNGTTFSEISSNSLGQVRIPAPPLPTQRAIADYLDRETSEFDGMLADLDEMERLLTERRAAFIGSAVRQESPHGEKVSLQSVASIHAGDSITSSEITEHGEYRVYGGNGVRGYCDHANQLEDKVLVGRQGALCGNVHLARGPFYASEHALVVEPRIEVSLNWLTLVLQDQKLGQLSMSAAQPGITASSVGLQRIPLPPLAEQRRIADEIDRETAEIDSMLSDITKLRDLLAERRTALISAAVTGQIDIPVSPTHKDEAHA